MIVGLFVAVIEKSTVKEMAHGIIRCFKIILARVSEKKLLDIAKKISAQPTARKNFGEFFNKIYKT